MFINMCIREKRTGLNYLTNSNGETEHMCPTCKFQDECHKQTAERVLLNGNKSLAEF